MFNLRRVGDEVEMNAGCKRRQRGGRGRGGKGKGGEGREGKGYIRQRRYVRERRNVNEEEKQ